MDSSVLRKIGSRAVVALLGLTACMGSMQAAIVLTATPNPVSINCDPGGNSTTATVVVTPIAHLSGTTSISVGLGTIPSPLQVTPPGATVLNATTQTAGLTYTIALAPSVNSCSGLPPSVTFNFKAGTATDVLVTVQIGSFGLAATPALTTLTCTKVGSTYTPGPAQTISVTSTTLGSTTVPFTIDTSATSWVSASASSGTASSSASTFTVSAASGCGGFASGTQNTGTISVKVTAEPTVLKTITVVLKIVGPTPLIANPTSLSLSYVKGSGSPGKATLALSSSNSPAPFFTINQATLKSWITVDRSSISGNTPKSVTFSSTSLADTLAPGTYTDNVSISVSGSADLIVPVTLLITNKAASLTVAEGTTRDINWVQGSTLPTPVITAVSSDSPIPYTLTTGGTLAPIVSASQQSGLAYNFGSQIGVTFDPVLFASAQPGQVLTGTVSLTWGTPKATIVVTFNITVQSAGATLTGISPAGLPTATAGQTFQVTLTGSGFVPGTDPTQKTKVGIVIGSTLVPDTNISANVLNASNMILTITVPSTADPNLPFSPSGTGGAVTLGVCNPVGGTCTIPTGSMTFTIGNNPIIEAVTSASAFIQVAPPDLQTVAPYDMASIFGTNFCSSGGTGCSSTQVLYGTPSAGLLQYPFSLSPDPTGPTQRNLTVGFYQHGTTTLIANATLLFATNSQINVVVPSAVSGNASVDVIVNFGYGTGTTMKSSAPMTLAVADTNPGMFTIGQDGQGSGAILDAKWNLVSSSNPGAMRSIANDSDTLALYLTGLGIPDSTADNSITGGGSWSADCASTASFLSTLNSTAQASLTTLDGVVIQSGLLNTGRFVPCVTSSSANLPTVTVGGISATVVYAGWVADTIAGLYQVNVKLPGTNPGSNFTTSTGATVSTITAPVQLPLVVTANGKSSQPGVIVWVAPRLLVTAPSALSGTVGVLWPTSGNSVVASEGTSAYRYALSSGLLPSGLSLNPTTGAITGIPAANTAGSYTVTVTATDSANVPVTGTATFTLTVAGGLYVTSTGTSPFQYTFGSAHAGVTTVIATGGTWPYTYAITAPASIPTGMSVSASGVVGVTALTPAGTYDVTVTATDSDASPLTGVASFTIEEDLNVTNSGSVSSVTNGNAGAITPALTTTGQTGTVTYSLDAATTALGWVTIDSSTGAVSVTASSVAGAHSVTVTATDSTAAPGSSAPATGTYTFNMTIN